MTDLPTGTVTFLFTDIEGSTGLLQALGDRYPAVLDEHAAILRQSVADHGGVEVSTHGDAFFVVFPSPAGAVRAAVAAQQALAGHDWSPAPPLRVRMGVHTGEGTRGGDDYVGLDVHRAARIAAAPHRGAGGPGKPPPGPGRRRPPAPPVPGRRLLRRPVPGDRPRPGPGGRGQRPWRARGGRPPHPGRGQ